MLNRILAPEMQDRIPCASLLSAPRTARVARPKSDGFLALALLTIVLAAGSLVAQNPSVTMTTSKGTIVIELDADKAPKTVENFLAYVDAGFYDGTIFHRVIDGFMIQGGGFTSDMQKKQPRDPIENESKNGLSNARGTISMARTGDPHSATAQFFINTVDNGGLDASGGDWGYAVFGRVTSGMETVDAISSVAVTKEKPNDTVMIESVSRN